MGFYFRNHKSYRPLHHPKTYPRMSPRYTCVISADSRMLNTNNFVLLVFPRHIYKSSEWAAGTGGIQTIDAHIRSDWQPSFKRVDPSLHFLLVLFYLFTSLGDSMRIICPSSKIDITGRRTEEDYEMCEEYVQGGNPMTQTLSCSGHCYNLDLYCWIES